MKRSVEMMGISHEKRWGRVQFAWEQRVGARPLGLRCASWLWVPALLDEVYKLVSNWETDAEHMT